MTHQTPAEQGEAAARKEAQRNLPEPWRPPNEQSAAETYGTRQGRIQQMMLTLAKATEHHAHEFLGPPNNGKSYGFSGDLARVECLLAQAVQALGGTTAADDEAWGL